MEEIISFPLVIVMQFFQQKTRAKTVCLDIVLRKTLTEFIILHHDDIKKHWWIEMFVLPWVNQPLADIGHIRTDHIFHSHQLT
jgi:hypothetical protein